MSSSSKASFVSAASGFRGRRGRGTSRACALALILAPLGADAAGVYENAATESALLLAPDRVVVRGTVEISSDPPVEASLYRVLGTFPVRSWFLLWAEMPFVAVDDSSGIESGPGDFILRARARAWAKRLSLLATVGTGTGNRRFFPYSSQTLDIAASVGYVDSVGSLHPFVIAGYEWINRIDEEDYTDDTRPADHARFTAGVDADVGPRWDVFGGAMFHWYETGARRALLFAGGRYEWTARFQLGAEGQAEVGPQAQRVSDWSLTAGLAVSF